MSDGIAEVLRQAKADVASRMYTVSAYDFAFNMERARAYPVVDVFEQRMGYALDRARLLGAARVLACPLKAHAPNWQHGRVLYAVARAFLRGKSSSGWACLDIGTAKGFSALCLHWALMDHAGGTAVTAGVTSVDVLDPLARVKRNTVVEVEGFKSLADILAPWSEARSIRFEQSTGVDWLKCHPERVHIAFVDGKHQSDVVLKEGKLLADRQHPGDVVMFDDVQIPGVASALKSLDAYRFEYIDLTPVERIYAVGMRR